MHDVILVKQRKGLKVTKKLGKQLRHQAQRPDPGRHAHQPARLDRGRRQARRQAVPLRQHAPRGGAGCDARRAGQGTRRRDRAAAHQEAAVRHRRHELRSGGSRVDGQRGGHPRGRRHGRRAGRCSRAATRATAAAWRSPDLSDTSPASFDHRIDFVFVKPKLKALKGWVSARSSASVRRTGSGHPTTPAWRSSSSTRRSSSSVRVGGGFSRPRPLAGRTSRWCASART